MYALEEPLQILGVDAGRDAMTKICYPCLRLPRNLEACAHAPNLALDGFFAAVQQVRVQVALERGLALDEVARLTGLDAPVEPKNVIARALGHHVERLVCTLGEECHRHDRHASFCELAFDAFGDALQGRVRELFEVMRRELASPRVEDLQQLSLNLASPLATLIWTYLSTSFYLLDQEVCADVRDANEKLVGFFRVLE